MEKKQTAVELLIQAFTYKTIEGRYTTDGTDDVTNIVNKSLKVEKEQIMNAYKDGRISVIAVTKTPSEQYYNETYGNTQC